jgi:hypothetical protein
MIENKELGVKFAESEEEAEWYRTKEDMEMSIKGHKARIQSAQKDLKVTDREIVKRFRSGANKLIKEIKQVIQIQEEILKFIETKIKKN